MACCEGGCSSLPRHPRIAHDGLPLVILDEALARPDEPPADRLQRLPGLDDMSLGHARERRGGRGSGDIRCADKVLFGDLVRLDQVAHEVAKVRLRAVIVVQFDPTYQVIKLCLVGFEVLTEDFFWRQGPLSRSGRFRSMQERHDLLLAIQSVGLRVAQSAVADHVRPETHFNDLEVSPNN